MQQLGSVLIVDDDATSNFLSAFTLRRANVTKEIFEVENGRDALELVARKVVNFILLDVNMPIMNGTDFLKALKELRETANFTPPVIVLLTTSESYLDSDSITQNPMVKGFLTKPLTEDHVNYLESLVRDQE